MIRNRYVGIQGRCQGYLSAFEYKLIRTCINGRCSKDIQPLFFKITATIGSGISITDGLLTGTG